MIKIYGKFNFAGMTIFPFIFIDRGSVDGRLIRHEKIHIAQQMEVITFAICFMYFINLGWWSLLGYLFYFILYFIEWLVRGIIYKDLSLFGEAYEKISFEKEAHFNENNVRYFKKRVPFNWIRYIWQ